MRVEINYPEAFSQLILSILFGIWTESWSAGLWFFFIYGTIYNIFISRR